MINDQGQSGFYLLSDNTDAFIARFALATAAKKTLDIQYYIMHRDASGQYLAYAILNAADRGVKVRILVDDINLSGRDNNLKALSQHDNIEIRIFNPLNNRNWFRNLELLVNLDRAGRRMHNKAFIVDDAVAIIGGRNIGDEYFDARKKLNFVDLDLLSTGPIVQDITISFDDYWNSHWATPIEKLSKIKVAKLQLNHIRNNLKDRWHNARNTHYFKSLQHSDLTRMIIDKDIPLIYADAKLFYDRPEKLIASGTDELIHFGPKIMPFFEKAKHEMLIATPYFVPGVPGSNLLVEKQRDGTDISILTNSLSATDVIAVHAGYRKYRKRLVKAGLKLFELKSTAKRLRDRTKKILQGLSGSSLHAKYMVVDRRYVFIGSANIDPRSNNLNTEIGVMVDSEELANQASALFRKTTHSENSYELSVSDQANKASNNLIWQTTEDGDAIKFTSEPNASLWRRMIVLIVSMLPIESLL
jgi:putative cardiolipin synthase